jgi:hypothetical protein
MEPCELEALVRVLAPYAVAHAWAPAVDPEMVLLQVGGMRGTGQGKGLGWGAGGTLMQQTWLRQR